MTKQTDGRVGCRPFLWGPLGTPSPNASTLHTGLGNPKTSLILPRDPLTIVFTRACPATVPSAVSPVLSGLVRDAGRQHLGAGRAGGRGS